MAAKPDTTVSGMIFILISLNPLDIVNILLGFFQKYIRWKQDLFLNLTSWSLCLNLPRDGQLHFNISKHGNTGWTSVCHEDTAGISSLCVDLTRDGCKHRTTVPDCVAAWHVLAWNYWIFLTRHQVLFQRYFMPKRFLTLTTWYFLCLDLTRDCCQATDHCWRQQFNICGIFAFSNQLDGINFLCSFIWLIKCW